MTTFLKTMMVLSLLGTGFSFGAGFEMWRTERRAAAAAEERSLAKLVAELQAKKKADELAAIRADVKNGKFWAEQEKYVPPPFEFEAGDPVWVYPSGERFMFNGIVLPNSQFGTIEVRIHKQVGQSHWRQVVFEIAQFFPGELRHTWYYVKAADPSGERWRDYKIYNKRPKS